MTIELGGHNLILVAHPDDEAMWGASLPIRFGESRLFTVICCSIPRRDPIRAWKFFDSCYRLGAFPRILPFHETEVGSPLSGLETLGSLPEYDCIITHGPDGEYGHSHHVSVHDYAKSIANGRKFITFAYRAGNTAIFLSHEEQMKKANALRAYDHILPYNGREIPKWEALLERYYETENRDFGVEYFGTA